MTSSDVQSTTAPASRSRLWWGLLALVLLAHLGVNLVWLSQDQTMRGFDEPPHITAEAHAYNLVAAHGVTGAWEVLRGRRAGQWPSGGYLPWVPLSMVFGHSITNLRLFNLAYLALLLAAVFVICRRLHSPQAGVIAAILLTFYPAIFGASRQFNHDLPYIAVVAGNLALMLHAQRFSRLRASALLGLGLGFAVLVRPHSLILLAAPGLFWVVVSLVRPSAGRGRVVLGMVITALCTLGSSAVWWFERVDTIQLILVEHVTGRVNLPWMTDPSIVFYFKKFPSGSSFFLLVIALLSIVGLLAGTRAARQAGRPIWSLEFVAIWVWLLLGLAAISVFRVHLNRYQFPLYPALAVITGVGLAALPWTAIRRGLVSFSLLGGAAVWLICSFSEARPLPAWAMDCDPCSSRPRGERWESSGVPDTDTIIAAMNRVADRLQQERDTGEGVVLQTHPHLRMALMIKPVLLTRLPLLQISHRPLDEYGRDQRNEECESLHQTLGGFSLPLPHLPWDRCFTLKVDFRFEKDAEVPADPVPDANAIFETRCRWGGGIVRFNLWDHPTCPKRDPPHIDPRTGKVVIPCP